MIEAVLTMEPEAVTATEDPGAHMMGATLNPWVSVLYKILWFGMIWAHPF